MNTPTTPAAASSCLVIDASCDIPESALAHPQLRMLPVAVLLGKNRVYDSREPSATQAFYRVNLMSPSALEARSEPMTVEQMSEFLLEQVALTFDQVLGVFVSSTRSAIHERAKQAMSRVQMNAFPKRVRAKKLAALVMQSTDSLALFAGYGVQVMSLLDALAEGLDWAALQERQALSAAQTYCYVAPGDVSYILKRAKLKGENSVSALAGFAAKALSITPILRAYQGQTEPISRKRGASNAREAIVELARNGLEQGIVTSRHLCFSYSGDLASIEAMPSYQQVQQLAQQQGIAVHLALMSTTGAVNVGPDTLTVGMLAKPHEAADIV
jgi:fatty acid-binding protein DegV